MTDAQIESRIAQIRQAFEADETRIQDEHMLGSREQKEGRAPYGCLVRVDFEADYMPRQNAIPFAGAEALLELRYPSDNESGDDTRVALWRIGETEALSITTWLPPYCDDEADGSGHIKYFRWHPEDTVTGIARVLEQARREAVADLLAPLRVNLSALIADETKQTEFAEAYIDALRTEDPAREFALSQQVSDAAERWHDLAAQAVLRQSSKVVRIDIETESAIDDEGGFYRDVVRIGVTASDGIRLDFRGDYEWWDAFEGSDAEDDIAPIESEEQARGKLEELFGAPDWPLFWQALYSLAARTEQQGQIRLDLTREAAP